MFDDIRKFLDELNEQKWFYYTRCIVRSLILYGVFALISGLVLLLIKIPDDQTALRAYHIFCTLAHFFVFNTVVRAFKIFDTKVRIKTLGNGKKYLGAAKELKRSVATPEFIIESLVIILLSATCDLLGHAAFINSIFLGVNLSYATQKLITVSIIIPIYLILDLIATRAAIKYWKVLRDIKDPYDPTAFKKVRDWWYSVPNSSDASRQNRFPAYFTDLLGLIKQVVLGAILYMFGFPILSPILNSFVGSPEMKLRFTVSFLGIILCIAAIIWFIIFVPKYIRALAVRRKFIKNLRKAHKRGSFKMTEIKHPYISVFKARQGFDFTITQGGRSYDCKLMATNGRFNTASFLPDGYILRSCIVKFMRTEMFRFESKTYYNFESKNEKIIILSPIAKNVNVCEGGRLHQLDIGHTVFGYKIFNGQGLINSLERECIDRF